MIKDIRGSLPDFTRRTENSTARAKPESWDILRLKHRLVSTGPSRPHLARRLDVVNGRFFVKATSARADARMAPTTVLLRRIKDTMQSPAQSKQQAHSRSTRCHRFSGTSSPRCQSLQDSIGNDLLRRRDVRARVTSQRHCLIIRG